MDKISIIKKLFWDKDIDVNYILQLLEGKPEHIPGDRIDLHRRFLTSYDWYTLLEFFTIDTLKNEVLVEKVICRLFPKGLWVDPLEICKIIKEFPEELLKSVKWIDQVDIQLLGNSIDLIHDDIFFGSKNSLYS